MHATPPDRDQETSSSVRKAPATRALLLQACAFVAVALLSLIWSPGSWVAAALQGVLAAALSRWQRLAVWWLPIQLCFPLAVVGLQAVQLPPWIFLVGFFLLLLLYWSSFRTQVPYYPSSRAAGAAVVTLLPVQPGVRFIDIGSGFGGLVLDLARQRPDAHAEGIEIAPLPWLISWLRARLQRSRARLRRGDYTRLSFAEYDVVFAYLSPAAMPELWRKASRELRPGSLLLSLEFSLPDVAPHFILQPEASGPPLFGWRF